MVRIEMQAKSVAKMVAAVALLLGLWACIERPMRKASPSTRSGQTILVPESSGRDVDMLFLVDSSQSMQQEQHMLEAQFVSLMNELNEMGGGLPNVHVGVVTPDLGSGSYEDRTCSMGGDGAVLGRVKGVDRGEQCIGPGQRYLVDVEPANCKADRGQDGQCTSDPCTQADCDSVAQAGEHLVLTHDSSGCPRCRNYEGTLQDAFRCLAKVGSNGCGFEQQLEAVTKALDVNETPENRGFVRDGSLLAVILITDEDDCSAQDPNTLFRGDPSGGTCDDTLGCRSNYRCFDFGIQCDVNDRTVGVRKDCSPRKEGDPHLMLQPVSRYTAFFEALRDPNSLILAAITGPVADQVQIVADSSGRLDIAPSCTASDGTGAAPAIRIRELLEHFNKPEDMNQWAMTSICAEDFSSALAGIGAKVRDAIEPCMAQPLAGCSQGTSGTSCSACLPTCRVTDLVHWSRQDQKQYDVPWCGAVCQHGLCTKLDLSPCNSDDNGRCTCNAGLYPTKIEGQKGCAPLLFANGVPDSDRVPQLADVLPQAEPTCQGLDCTDVTMGRGAACWYVAEQQSCAGGSAIRIARASDAPADTYAEVRCSLVPAHEDLCYDGVDNDEDCLIDAEDPDCAAPVDSKDSTPSHTVGL